MPERATRLIAERGVSRGHSSQGRIGEDEEPRVRLVRHSRRKRGETDRPDLPPMALGLDSTGGERYP